MGKWRRALSWLTDKRTCGQARCGKPTGYQAKQNQTKKRPMIVTAKKYRMLANMKRILWMIFHITTLKKGIAEASVITHQQWKYLWDSSKRALRLILRLRAKGSQSLAANKLATEPSSHQFWMCVEKMTGKSVDPCRQRGGHQRRGHKTWRKKLDSTKKQLFYFEWSPPWHFKAYILTYILTYGLTCSFYLTSIRTFYLPFFLASYLAPILAFYLATCYVPYLMIFFLAYVSGMFSDILSAIISGISSEILCRWRGSLGSSVCCSGPAGNTAI